MAVATLCLALVPARTRAAAAIARAQPWHVGGMGGVFDVTKYGAVGDGKTKDTKAVRAAAAALESAGGGTLLFPNRAAAMPSRPGGASSSATQYLTGAFNLSSNTYMQIDTGVTLLGSTDGGDWPLLVARTVWPQMGHGSDCTPGSESCRLMHQAFVFSWQTRNVSVGGGGTIDTQGKVWWDCAKDLSKAPCNGYGRPHLSECPMSEPVCGAPSGQGLELEARHTLWRPQLRARGPL